MRGFMLYFKAFVLTLPLYNAVFPSGLASEAALKGHV
jgi:hypothetical protein